VLFVVHLELPNFTPHALIGAFSGCNRNEDESPAAPEFMRRVYHDFLQIFLCEI
jgi:hypothetical protein